ncbi:Hsp70 family protein [Luedemannella flava]|uniref:Hsp70 family protein n=1 Tax=Luedemannella flava TaxID=349316 RepID=UPI0031D80068
MSVVRLGLDYGAAATKAVIALPGRDPTPLRFDGALTLPSAVLIEPGGDLVVGLAAWRRASEHPQRFVPAPARLAHLPTIDADTDVVPVVDLIAATLRRVATEAATHSGGPVDEVMLTVPAGWGPHRRDLLRRAAHTAGLPNAQLVPAPVAVAWHLLAHAPVADSPILVCDLGAGTTATVLRRRPGGFDILSTIEEPDAGGMAVDLAVLDAVTARARAAAPADQTTGGESPDEVSWYADLDQARTAKEALAHHTSVVVSLPHPLPAVSLTRPILADTAGLVLARAADTAHRTITAADLPTDSPLQVCCVGAGALLPGAVEALAQRLPAKPTVVDEPHHAAARGAVARPTETQTVAQPMQMPDGRDVAVAVGAAATAGAMTVLFLADTNTNTTGNGTIQFAPWGLLASAAVHITIAVITIALLMPWLAPGALPSTAGSRWRLPILLPAAAAAAGATVLAIATIITAVGHLPINTILAWTVLPVLPVAVGAAAAGLATRRDPPPPWRWLDRLRPPLIPLALGATALMVIHATGDATSLALPATLALPIGALLYAGAVVGLLTTTIVARLLFAVPIAPAALLLAVADAGAILAVGYAAAIATWWIIRAVNPPTSHETPP